MESTLLQAFLLVNVFIIGALSVIGAQHARAHFRPHTAEPKDSKPKPSGGHLSAEVKQRLLHDSEAQFEAVTRQATADLSRDLAETSDRLNKALEKLGREIVSQQMTALQDQLEHLRAQTAEATKAQHEAAEGQHQQLKAQMAEEIAAEKQRLLAQIDTKLGDAVLSFLDETMQHNIDLGAQTPYLTSMLDKHKAELAKEMGREA